MKRINQHQRNLLWYAFPSFLASGLSVLLLPLYTRYLTPADFGAVGIAMVVSQLMRICLLPGLEGVYLRHGYQETECGIGPTKAFKSILTIHFGLAFIGIPLISIPVLLLSHHFAPGIPPLFIVMAIATIPVGSLFGPRDAELRLGHSAKKLAHVYLVNTLASTLAILLCLYLGLGPASLLVGELAAVLALAPAGVAAIWRGQTHGWDVSQTRSVLQSFVALGPESLTFWAFTAVDRFLLNFFAGSSEVGIYLAASQIGSVILAVVLVAAKQWKVFIIQYTASHQGEDDPRFRRLYVESLHLFFAIAALVAIAAPLCRPLLGPKFQSAAQLVPILALSGFLRVPAIFISHYCFSKMQRRLLSSISLTAFVVLLVFNMLLIPTYGSQGAAWAGVIASSVYILSTFFLGWKIFRLPSLGEQPIISLVCLASFIASLIGINSGVGYLVGMGMAVLVICLRQAINYWNMLAALLLPKRAME